MRGAYRSFDQYQRRHRWIGFPLAVRPFGIAWKLGSILAAVALNFLLFWVAFRVLTTRDVGWREVRGGALAAAVLYELLQILGGYYVGHVLKNASNTYGTFGLVIGLLSWIYLAAHVTLLAAQGNVVAHHHLWPRSFSLILEQPLTDGDRRALTLRSEVEERRQDQAIDVTFTSNAPPHPESGSQTRQPDAEP